MTLITMSRAVGKGMGDTLIDAFLSLFGEERMTIFQVVVEFQDQAEWYWGIRDVLELLSTE